MPVHPNAEPKSAIELENEELVYAYRDAIANGGNAKIRGEAAKNLLDRLRDVPTPEEKRIWELLAGWYMGKTPESELRAALDAYHAGRGHEPPKPHPF